MSERYLELKSRAAALAQKFDEIRGFL